MILLDTHAWVRWLHPELIPALPEKLRSWLEYAPDDLAVSVLSCLEIAQSIKRNRLILPLGLPEWYDAALDESGIRCLPLTPVLLHESSMLPDVHRDPVDRILIATAMRHDAVLVTADSIIPRYPGIRCVWTLP